MTQPPNGSAAPPGRPDPSGSSAPGTLYAPAPRATVPAQSSAPGLPRPAGSQPPARRTAWAEGVDRLRAAATTEPGRLRTVGAVLALLILAFGLAAGWQMTDRSAAADDVLHRSQPLSSDAATIYGSLADANTAASTAFLLGGQGTDASTTQYGKDIDTAARKLAKAAAASEPDSDSAKAVTRLNRLLPRYTGLVERARAGNRQGLPLGSAYLRYANDLMQEQMLPAAEELYASENDRLRGDYDDATPYPWAAIGLGAVALGALAWAQRRSYLHTNRVLNRGLLAGTAACTVLLLWLAVGHTLARSGLNNSYEHGVRSANVLSDARIAALKARGNENLTLVSRGAETDDNGEDAFDVEYRKQQHILGGEDGTGGLLRTSRSLADDQAGRTPVQKASAAVEEWQHRHLVARRLDDTGDYEGAQNKVVGPAEGKPTGVSFHQVDTALQSALDHEQGQFLAAARDGRGAMRGLVAGAAVLAVLGAAATVLGIGRRLSEYR
ncbi:hypothetical protein [Streptomyces sp. NPDC058045]|uniref:hypothetical protein n=1 Tax=Streptomyces sp. NPDC058045 TaxID=3346311 RepID=UPI0036EDAA8E